MVLPTLFNNNQKVYHVSGTGHGTLPDWLIRQNKKQLKKDHDFSTRVELIQDFSFPEASLRIKKTKQGGHIIATGVYKPQVRVFDCNELCMKFDRHFDSENVQFEILSDDWTKLCFLQSDRSVEFHSQGGLHYKTRIPRFGRDLAYQTTTGDLLLVGSSDECWRLSLERGQFLAPLNSQMDEINTVKINHLHEMVVCGGVGMEFFDTRSVSSLGFVDCGMVTSACFLDELTLVVGSDKGMVQLFDIRQLNSPIITKEHQYGGAIKSLLYHNNHILSADSHVIKVWEKTQGNLLTSIESPNPINDMCVDEGLIMLANEGIEIQSFYAPCLAPAPKWCSFLENMTEEMEESKTQILYENYKFLTRNELEKLCLDHLIGTKTVKASLHGFFIDHRLYEKAKAIANPFAFEDYRKKLIQQKVEEARKSRIGAVRKVKVNPDVPFRDDDRFKAMFDNPDYKIDKESYEYKLLHPVAKEQDRTRVEQDGSEHSEHEEQDFENVKVQKMVKKKSLMTFSDRLKRKQQPPTKQSIKGNVQVSFDTKKSKHNSTHQRTGRRGVKELGLKQRKRNYK